MGKEVNWPWSVKQHTMFLSYPGAEQNSYSLRDVLAQNILYIPSSDKKSVFKTFGGLGEHEAVLMQLL